MQAGGSPGHALDHSGACAGSAGAKYTPRWPSAQGTTSVVPKAFRSNYKPPGCLLTLSVRRLILNISKRAQVAGGGKPAADKAAPQSILERVRALEERVPALAARAGHRAAAPARPPPATLLSRVEALEAGVGTLLALQACPGRKTIFKMIFSRS